MHVCIGVCMHTCLECVQRLEDSFWELPVTSHLGLPCCTLQAVSFWVIDSLFCLPPQHPKYGD